MNYEIEPVLGFVVCTVCMEETNYRIILYVVVGT